MKLIQFAIFFGLVVSVSATAGGVVQWSFVCGDDMFMCGGLSKDVVCNNDNKIKSYKFASDKECAAMIKSAKKSRNSCFNDKCPNGKKIKSYIKYEPCKKKEGKMFFLNDRDDKTCKCPSGQCGKKSKCSAGGGDPHFRTQDGFMYSYHGECDLVMARSSSFGNGLGLDVHARTEIVTDWSLVSNAAVRIGDDIFEVDNNGKHYYNGVADVALPIVLAGQYEVNKSEESVTAEDIGTFYKIDLKSNGDEINLSVYKKMIGVNVNVDLPDTNGMLGTSNTEGLVGRDGTTVLQDVNEMGSQWQVTDKEAMLFHEIRAPQYPTRCNLPRVNSRLLRQTPETYAAAKEACMSIDDETLNALCIEDVLKTGDKAAAATFGSVF